MASEVRKFLSFTHSLALWHFLVPIELSQSNLHTNSSLHVNSNIHSPSQYSSHLQGKHSPTLHHIPIVTYATMGLQSTNSRIPSPSFVLFHPLFHLLYPLLYLPSQFTSQPGLSQSPLSPSLFVTALRIMPPYSHRLSSASPLSSHSVAHLSNSASLEKKEERKGFKGL